MTALSEHPSLPDCAQHSADTLIRRLARRYVLVLAAVAALVVIDQAVIQPLLIRLNRFAPAINVAGRQRMLSQRLTKAALALQAAESQPQHLAFRDELETTLRQWSAAHEALLGRGDVAGVERLNNPQIIGLMAQLEPHFQAMRSAASMLIEHPSAGDHDSASVQTAHGVSATEAVSAIVRHEAGFLPLMDSVVKLLEDEAGREVARLRIYGLTIASAVVGLLLVLGWFVVHPATRAIRKQVDELETRVTQRTSELAEANSALEHEIRQREEEETKTRHLAAQLAHAARVSTMGHLTAGLAHEINQPLTAIANYAEACELLGPSHGPSQPARLQANLDGIKQAALRAGQIVRRMRNFVRPGGGSLQEVDLNELIREVAELCRLEAERAQVRTTFELSACDARVRADPIQIQQVIVNLLNNAFQAMQACSPDRRNLVVQTVIVENNVQVSVSDSGPGIAESDLQPLFTPFYTTKPDGLGIGLAICSSIIHQHAGRIWAESPHSRGATICFELPRHQQNDAARTEPSDCICR